MAVARLCLFLLLALMCGCKVGGCVANSVGDVVGETGDVSCDRRFTAKDGGAEPFCQEVMDTVAVSRVQEDCRDKHAAKTYEGRCPRERLLGGCKLSKANDDGSEVTDWFYDTSDLEEAGTPFPGRVASKDAVRRLCEDRKRYEEGASFVDP